MFLTMTGMSLKDDQMWMRRALQLAKKGIGRTSPNPCVGALLVRNGRLIGSGWHRGAGLPHAEIEAIKSAYRGKEKVTGSTLYVTLEPCSTWGRTPPCTDRLISEKIARVVIGTVDPNPKHQGRGYRLLQKAGIKVAKGILNDECKKLNEAWNYWIIHQIPWVIAKCGMTLDGKIATANGESRWITSLQSRKQAHLLRSRVDAIVVGIETVLKDDPSLTVRHHPSNLRFTETQLQKQPLRIILDTHARIPLTAQVFEQPNRTWLMVGATAAERKIGQLEKRGVRVSRIRLDNGKIAIETVLKLLGKAQITNLLVEGGGSILGTFFREKKVQEIVFFIAPMILGGKTSIHAVGGVGFPTLAQSLKLDELEIQKIGTDLMVHAKVFH